MLYHRCVKCSKGHIVYICTRQQHMYKSCIYIYYIYNLPANNVTIKQCVVTDAKIQLKRENYIVYICTCQPDIYYIFLCIVSVLGFLGMIPLNREEGYINYSIHVYILCNILR